MNVVVIEECCHCNSTTEKVLQDIIWNPRVLDLFIRTKRYCYGCDKYDSKTVVVTPVNTLGIFNESSYVTGGLYEKYKDHT